MYYILYTLMIGIIYIASSLVYRKRITAVGLGLGGMKDLEDFDNA